MENILDGYPPMLNVEQAAYVLGITPKTFRGIIKSENINVMRIGKRIRIPKTELLYYIECSVEKKG